MPLFRSPAFVILLLATPLLFTRDRKPVELHSNADTPFRFVVYGDTRFTDPADTHAASPSGAPGAGSSDCRGQSGFHLGWRRHRL